MAECSGQFQVHRFSFQERSLRARASCPLQHTGGPSQHLWAFGPLAGGTPALPGTPFRMGAFPGTAGILPASTHRWAFATPVGLRPTCGRDARAPRNTVPHGRFPWDRGHLARFNTPVGLRNTCGPSAHLRAGRPRSQEHRSAWALSLGPRASCPLQHTGGPSQHLWAFGPLAGGTPALPGTPFRMGAFPGTAGILPASTHRRGPGNTGGPSEHRWASGLPVRLGRTSGSLAPGSLAAGSARRPPRPRRQGSGSPQGYGASSAYRSSRECQPLAPFFDAGIRRTK